MRFLKRHILLICILILGLVVRTLFITSVPVSSNDDQMHYFVNTQSFLQTGKDMSGTISPFDLLIFRYPPHESTQAELTYFLEMASFGLLGASLLSSVIPFIVLSIGTILITYFVGKELVNKQTGLAAAFITAINPWSIFIGRTAYEPAAATFFFLLALLVFLKAKSWWILTLIPILYLGFYSYIGTKIIVLPFVIICSLYSYYFINKKKYALQYVLVIVSVIMLGGLLFFQIKNTSTSRLNEIYLPNNPSVTKQVDELRSQSLKTPLNSITINKFTQYGRILTLNTFNVFSPIYLFMTGDYFFSQQRHGLFYVIDAILLLFGFFGLYRKNKKVFLLVLSFIAIGLLPQILHDSEGEGNFTPHIILIISMLIFVIGNGIVYLLHELRPKIRKISAVLIIGLYLISLVNFQMTYLTLAPKQYGVFNFADRALSKYIKESAKMHNVTVIARDPALTYRNYVFYSGAYSKDTWQEINRDLTKKDRFILPHIHFIPCTQTLPKNGDTIIRGKNCYFEENSSGIKLPDISGQTIAYTIYNDRFCHNKSISTYQNLSLSDLHVEALNDNQFCGKVLTY